MNPKTCHIEHAAICVFFLLLALWGIAWSFTSGLILSGIDGIMLLAICLIILAAFAAQLLLTARQAGWVKFAVPKAKAEKAAAAKAPAPPVAAAPAKSGAVAPQPVERAK